ncbi:MAG: hypothetical protein KTR22_10485 [Flavobacteriaceae bacterium]|nr:hypothetical protein [Flavobacteriaceae bacterium]
MRMLFLLSLIFCFSCRKQDPKDHITHLTGYWEIDQVTMPDGSIRNFPVNTMIDYIEVQGDSGTRKKLAPLLDGTFRTTKVTEKFYLQVEDGDLRMHYKTPYTEWTETVIKSGDSLLKVLNEDGKTYVYKKFNPINLE